MGTSECASVRKGVCVRGWGGKKLAREGGREREEEWKGRGRDEEE